MRHFWALLATCVAFGWSAPLAAQFPCDSTVYMVQDDQLSRVIITAPLGLEDIGPPAGSQYNAVGYNIIDGYIWGWDRGVDELLRVDETGAVTRFGVPSDPSPLPTVGYFVGDVDPLGRLYLQNPISRSTLYRVDLTSPTFAWETIALDASPFLADFAYNPRNGLLYGTGNGVLWEIDPSDGSTSTIALSGDPGAGSGTGAAWFDPFGSLFVYRNNPGAVFRINTSTGITVRLGSAPTVSLNDGTRCSVHLGFVKDVDPLIARPGETVTFTFLIVNPADPISPNVTIDFEDVLPAEVNLVPGTLMLMGSSSPPTINITGNMIDIDGIELEPQAEVTITVQAVVRADAPPGLVPSQATLSNVPPSAGGPTVLSHPTNAVAPEPTIFEVLDDRDADGVLNSVDPDDDNDGILDVDEGGDTEDTDGDGVPNRFDLDSDNDGIADLIENAGAADADTLDADRDGLPDDATDSNSDGIVDVLVGMPVRQTDIDTIADAYDLDADADGIYDILEADGPDTDGDGIVDNFSDGEGNGLATTVDPGEGGTPWPTPDSDGDVSFDFQDVDTDNDRVPDSIEGHDVNADGMADVAPEGTDSDGNGVDDAYDTNGTPAPLPNHDGVDQPDWRDIDDNNNGRPTHDGTNGDDDTNNNDDPTDDDDDGDGTPDYLDGDDNDGDGILDPGDPDDDNDGVLDVDEGGENEDTDGDGVPNRFDLDSDNDGIPDLWENGGQALDDDLDGELTPSDAAYEDADGDGLLAPFDDDDADPNVETTPEPGDNDGDGVINTEDLDADGDGICDVVEAVADGEAQDADGDCRRDDVVDGNDNGYDDALESDPLPMINTDEVEAPDYLDTDADDDGLDDSIEGHDTNGDQTPDTPPSGMDVDGNGVDDAYDSNGAVAVLPDFDNDGVPDYRDADSRGFGPGGVSGGSLGCGVEAVRSSNHALWLALVFVVAALRRRRS